ncbi:MAG TPA: S8 family serine peptidase [Candidatus Baltobacteraceae bacterium]|nr:S8 family serine peptidase [Candidatus Baltobacteraceae bacterium]
MKRPPLVLLFSFTLLLAACGGGGGGGGGSLPPGNGSGGVTVGGGTPTPKPTPTATPTPTPVPGAGQPLSGPRTHIGSWGPPAVAQDLDFPVQHAYDGTGQTIAIVIDSDVSRSDLTTFLNYFQIPTTGRTITTEAVSPLTAPKVGTNGSQIEAALDVETAASLAPGANIIIYQVADLSDQNLVNAYNQIISEHKAFIVNNSFGGCEYSPSALDPVLKTGSQDGIAFTFSSGDSGNVCDDTTKPPTVGPGYPADNPYVLGIGGNETSVSDADLLTNPVVWNDTCGGGSQCAAGGGVSAIYTIPSYQVGLAGTTSQSFRNEPDFSMPALDVAMFQGGIWSTRAGTSWSAPEAAALLAELYQYCGANGGPIGGVTNPATIPYYVFNQNTAAFTDVTSGNDQFGTATPFDTAASGYDDASGFGLPKGLAFVQTACPGNTPASGLIARSRGSMSIAGRTQRPVGDVTMNVAPRIPGLVDEGVRDESALTSVQVVLDPSVNLAQGEAAVVDVLQNAGFTITKRFANHLVVDAQAPSAAVGQFFRTRLHNVVQTGYGTRYMPWTQVVVPASISQYVATVSLDNIVKLHIPRQ